MYLRFTLSYRAMEDLLAQRGIEVPYEPAARGSLLWSVTTRRLRASLLLANPHTAAPNLDHALQRESRGPEV